MGVRGGGAAVHQCRLPLPPGADCRPSRRHATPAPPPTAHRTAPRDGGRDWSDLFLWGDTHAGDWEGDSFGGGGGGTHPRCGVPRGG